MLLVILNNELSQKGGPKLVLGGFESTKIETRILWDVYAFHGQLRHEFSP